MAILKGQILPDRTTSLLTIAILKGDILPDRTTSLQNIAIRKGKKILRDQTTAAKAWPWRGHGAVEARQFFNTLFAAILRKGIGEMKEERTSTAV